MGIRLCNLTVGYDRRPAVHHVSGLFQDGTLTAIIGPNGGGKSTLLKALAGIHRPMSGHIDWLDLQADDIGYLPQQSEVDRDFPISVRDVVAMGHWRRCGAFSALNRNARHQILDALEQVGMSQFIDRPIAALSTGQWQRVLFARLTVQNARVIMLDEPFAAIDSRTTHDLMHRLQQWQREGKTVIAVMHDLPLVREHFSHAVMLARELVAWGAVGDVMRDENFAHSAMLANSWHDAIEECDVVVDKHQHFTPPHNHSNGAHHD